MRDRVALADGSVLAFQDTGGPGPVVVLAHGGTTDSRLWMRQVPVLAGRFRVITYDWAGHGESGDPVGPYARHEQLLQLLDQLDVDRAALVGSSDGGKLALDVALLRPELVDGLVLVGSGVSGYQWPESFLTLYRQRVHEVVGPEPRDLETYVRATVEFLTAGPGRSWTDLDPEVWRLALEMFRTITRREWSGSAQFEARDLEPPAFGRLDQVEVPVLVVHGTEDVPGIVELSELLAGAAGINAAGIKGARHAVLPGAGHLPPLEQPDEFNRVLLDFLDTLTAGPAGPRSSA
ncbi:MULTISPECIES: alpha/beta fold hydrolase [Streptacidiphilus]|uniref:Alpha/beta fold hydrolase n=1 Tax=Streptacidiphilus cavernicola TaxID=3342716 RepID=A0ABV6V1D4_9ACTN|nr:alpha/beta hydrolase [Streptacidiphilus jeojiense]